MKFSVLLSVYYKENPEYFKLAIKSIIDQTVMPDEIVIVKDGPLTVELENVIENYTKNYTDLFNIISLKKNSGLGVALNIGLQKCKNSIVARMDTDDISLSNRFEKQLKIFENDKDIDVVGSLIQEYDIKMEHKEGIRYVPEHDKDIKKFMKSRNGFSHMTVMFKKESVLEAGGYIDCLFFEDYYLWCRMAQNKCKFYNIQEVLVNVRSGSEMLDRRGGRKYYKSIFNFYNKLYEIKYINLFQKYYYTIIRFAVASSSIIRKLIYKLILRKHNGAKYE